MFSTIGQRLRYMLYGVTPLLWVIFFLLVGMVPFEVPYFSAVAPSFTFMVIFFWTVHRPESVPYYLVFLVGLLQDFLEGSLAGLNAFMFLVMYEILIQQRRFIYGRSFPFLWLVFLLLSFLATVFSWGVTSFIAGSLVALDTYVVRLVFSCFLFPVLVWLMSRSEEQEAV